MFGKANVELKIMKDTRRKGEMFTDKVTRTLPSSRPTTKKKGLSKEIPFHSLMKSFREVNMVSLGAKMKTHFLE